MASPTGNSPGFFELRPIALLAAGIVAAYGTYVAYSNLTATQRRRRSINSLHRSNAVHRTSRSRSVPSIAFVEDGEKPYPDLVCTLSDHVYTFNLISGAPDRTDVLSSLPVTADAMEDLMQTIEVEALTRTFSSIRNHFYGLHEPADLHTALIDLDIDGLLAYEAHFTQGNWLYTPEHFRQAAVRYVETTLARQRRVETDRYRPPRSVGDAETVEGDFDDPDGKDSGQELKALMFHIAEEEAKKNAHVHRGTRCDACNKLPITGIRWHCLNCVDFDLCSACKVSNDHPRTHVFAEIQIPVPILAQPRGLLKPYYPGDEKYNTGPLAPSQRSQYAKLFGFDEPQIDAFWEQYLCLSEVSFDASSGENDAGISRQQFYRICVGVDPDHPIAPNYIYDRMFAFYDIDKDGSISFNEYVLGLSYLLRPSKRPSMSRVFNGYDADDDGYVSRADMVKMFRAKYIIHKEMIMDAVTVEDEHARHMGRNISRVLRSNQPISSLLSEEEVPQGERRTPVNKPVDQFGDPQVLLDSVFGQSILPNGQSDMDPTFWNAIFSEYGRPSRLSDLHPDFNERLDARLELRERYTGTESHRLDGDLERYLVRADTREHRPFESTPQSLTQEWRQDINRHSTVDHNYEQTKGDTIAEDIMQRDRAMPVTREERDAGLDVIYQTLDDGLNELLDTFFAEAEARATRVERTRHLRKRYRAEIDAFVASANSHVLDNEKTWMDFDIDEQGNIIERSKEPDSKSEDLLPPPTSGGPDIVEEIEPHDQPVEEVQPVVESRAPQLTQDELLNQIAETAVPTDHGSLAAMETNIRDQELAALLQAAGYSVDDNLVVEAEASDQYATIDPSNPTILFEENDRSSNEAEVWSSDESVADLPWTQASVQPRPEGKKRPGFKSSETTESVEESESEYANESNGIGGAKPTLEELEEWAMLEGVEREIVKRGGPARINLREFEECIERDREKGSGHLKGLVESWLEWAAF